MCAKLDIERCIMHLNTLKGHKSCLKKAKMYRLTVNTAWQAVVEGTRERHGENWMFPELSDAYRVIQEDTINQTGKFKTKVYSVELWKDSQLVAGELAYVVGSTFTSLTGWFNSAYPGAGTVQLMALGFLIKRAGFTLWDFGMPMKYKLSLGAHS